MAVYVIGDVHGCSKTLQALVEKQVQLKPDDKLFLLGDYVNKGPDSKGVLDYLMHLQQTGYSLTCIRGNHDQYLLAAAAGKEVPELKPEDLALTLKSFGIEKATDLPEQYRSWLQALPLYVVLEEYVLVHAGFNFDHDPWLSSADTMLTTKEFYVNKQKLGGRRLLHGHQPQPLQKIKEAIKGKADAIGLDSGCVYYRNEGMGNLVALRLNGAQLFLQPNLDQPYPINIKK